MIIDDAILTALTSLTNGENAIIITGHDSPLGGLTVQSLPEKQVQEGDVYTIRKVITIPAGISNIIFDPTAITTKFIALRPPVFTAIGGAYVKGKLYVGATYTLGTKVTGANRNQLSTNVAEAFIVELPATIPAVGTPTNIEWLIPVPSTPGVATSSGGKAGGNFPFIINPALTQRIELNNTDTNPAELEYNITWAEKVIS